MTQEFGGYDIWKDTCTGLVKAPRWAFDTRTSNIVRSLVEHGFIASESLEDIASKSFREWKKAPNVGKSTCLKIQKVLLSNGLNFRNEPGNWDGSIA